MNKFRLETSEKEVMGQVQYFAVMFRRETVEFNYRFKTAEARQAYVDNFYAMQAQIEARSENRKKAKAEARKNMVNPFKVGDVLYNSWGYDQTNIDFFQVVEVGPKSVKIREIGQIASYPPGYSSMSEFVAPDVDNFVGEAKTKTLQVSSDGRVYISSRHGSIKKYDGTPKYQSHYA